MMPKDVCYLVAINQHNHILCFEKNVFKAKNIYILAATTSILPEHKLQYLLRKSISIITIIIIIKNNN